jgi:tyrosine-protein phosphatase SIW14
MEAANPVTIEGVPNLYRVDTNLYRSAQPTEKGFEILSNMAPSIVRSVLNLRLLHMDPYSQNIERFHVRCEALLMGRECIMRCLRIITNTKNTPILVHCLHGADRTGVVIAAYRISVQGWPTDRAIYEMVNGGFGFHKDFYPNLIRLVQDWGLQLEQPKDRC